MSAAVVRIELIRGSICGDFPFFFSLLKIRSDTITIEVYEITKGRPLKSFFSFQLATAELIKPPQVSENVKFALNTAVLMIEEKPSALVIEDTFGPQKTLNLRPAQVSCEEILKTCGMEIYSNGIFIIFRTPIKTAKSSS